MRSRILSMLKDNMENFKIIIEYHRNSAIIKLKKIKIKKIKKCVDI